MPAPPQPVPVIGPIVFTVRFGAEDQHYDLSDLPCPRLVRHLARVVRDIAGEDGSQRFPASVQNTVALLRGFVTFVAATEPDAADEFDLDDLTPELLGAFEHMLLARYGEASRSPYTMMVCLVRMLRALQQAHPNAFDAEMQARLGFGATVAKGVTNPLDAYPMPVFDAFEQAAIADVRRIRDRILEGERLAAAGQDPDIGGWHRLENVLWHITHRGPLTSDYNRRPTLRRKLWLLGSLRALNRRIYLGAEDLVPFLILLICQTGMEPECAQTLAADCLLNPARGFVSVAYVKNRSHGRSHKTLRLSDGGALHFPGGLLRLAIRLTQRGRDHTGSDRLWVEVADKGLRPSFPGRRNINWTYPAWLHRHRIDQMTDRGGVAVRLDLRRLRKTFKSRQYLRTAGVLEDFTTGHTTQVAAGHYADIDAHRGLHEEAVEQGLREALDAALAPPVVLNEAGDRLDDGGGDLTPAQVRAALSTHDDVWLASCRDFYGSPFARKPGSGCPVAVWGCLECPNAVFTTRHLPSILSFLAHLDRQRDEFSVAEWTARYGLAFDRIVEGICPRFTPEQLITARAIAEAAGSRLALPAQLLSGVA